MKTIRTKAESDAAFAGLPDQVEVIVPEGAHFGAALNAVMEKMEANGYSYSTTQKTGSYAISIVAVKGVREGLTA